jgi:hypothetical protein
MQGTFWTAAEDAILKEVWHLEGAMEKHIHRLPGRSVDSATLRGKRLGLGRRYIAWTAEEDAILREFWPHSSVKSQLWKLPNRAWKSVINRALVLGLPPRKAAVFVPDYSWVDELAFKELSAGLPMNSIQLSSRIGASDSWTRRILRCDKQNHFRIVGWEHITSTGTGAWTAIWSVGSEPDVPMPKRSNAERVRAYRAKDRIKTGHINPFAAAIGLVAAPTSQPGRVYINLWDDKEELAA